MMRAPLASALLLMLLGCPTSRPQAAAEPAQAPALPQSSPGLPASLTTAHDLPPIAVTESSTAYDRAAMALPGFDGSRQDHWVVRGDQLCRGDRPRQVIVDVDQTAVSGNFVAKVEVNPAAREVLRTLDQAHGVTYLSANFAIDRIVAFLDRTGYPQVPAIARPRNYWKPDYGSWCKQGARYELCESSYKLDAIERMVQRCPQRDVPLIGLGDKFSDYLAYAQAGVCPLIVRDGHVLETNASEMAAGCTLDPDRRFAWMPDDRGLGDRCAVVPDRFVVGWDQIEARAEAVLSGSVACGAW
ncbi:MAG: hypothetical protein ABIJ09_21350 [Pseudomonadota bacterium]